MTNDQLKQSIAEIKVLMHTALDDKEKDLLSHLITGISKSHPHEIDDGITEQLDSKAVEFESRHPKLAKALRELMDTLSKMGI